MYSLENIARIVLTVALLLVAAIIHEVAHGYVAHLCGDDTAKEAGRLTLNPARHLEPFGSVVLPIIMAIAGGFVFSYAKPVPYNPYRLKNRRRDEVLVALAGPASNLLQAVVGALCFNGTWALVEASNELYFSGPVVLGLTGMQWLLTALSTYVWVNLMLAFFNLIPLPPLDGLEGRLLLPQGRCTHALLRGAALRHAHPHRGALPAAAAWPRPARSIPRLLCGQPLRSASWDVIA